MTINVRVAFGVCCVLVLTTVAMAETDSDFENAVKKYQKSKAMAEANMIKAFEQVANRIRSNKTLPAETRNRHITAIQDQKERFQKSNTLPESDDMLQATMMYLDELYAKAFTLQKMFDRALERAIGDREEFKRLTEIKDQINSTLPKTSEFARKAEWHGSYYYANGQTIDFHMHLDRGANGSFEGSLWRDASTAGKTGWAYEGKIDSGMIVLTTTKMIRGKSRQLNLKGYVIGHRLVMKCSVNGNAGTDIVSVWKK